MIGLIGSGDAGEQEIRRLESLALALGGAFLAGLALFVFSLLPSAPSLCRFAALALLAGCAGAALWLWRCVRTTLAREMGRRKEAELEARAADSAKGQLVSSVSHELRTPLHGMLGMTELLLAGDLTSAQREQVEVIGKSAAALLSLVNDILDLSRIEAARMLLRPRDFSFRELVGDVLRLLAPEAAQRGVELRQAIDSALPDDLYGDPERLRQVLVNLVGNGIRFTLKGSVTVRAEPLERCAPVIRCEVRDTGTGIRPEVQERLFQPFAQSGSSAAGGSGLGLVISRNIVELMGGEMGFHSTRGMGSTFWFRIPLVPARGGETAGLPGANLSAEAEARRLRRLGRRILVVDDRSANRAVAVALLQSLGYTAQAVETGEEALALQAERPCAAILLDVGMPGLDGPETCRRLRGQEVGRERTPVIALTAHTSAEERERCLAAGMDAFLLKPFRMGELAAVLDLWLGIGGAAEPESAPEFLQERLAGLGTLEDETGQPLLTEVVEAFLRQGEEDLATLRGALSRRDGEALAAAAHALAGSSGILGAADLARSAGALSRLAKQGDPEACARQLDEVEQEYRSVARRLRLNKC